MYELVSDMNQKQELLEERIASLEDRLTTIQEHMEALPEVLAKVVQIALSSQRQVLDHPDQAPGSRHTHSHLLLPLFFLLTGDRDSGIRFGGACGFRERGESETAIRESGARPVHRKPDVSIKRVPVHHICRQKGQKMRGKRNYSPPLIMLTRDVEYVIPLLISNTMVTKK